MSDDEEMNSFLKEECRGCKKKVKQIRKHLRYSKECEKLYDQDELVKESLKKDAERKRRDRSNHSEARKEEERNKNAARIKNKRENQNLAEQEEERRKVKEGMRNFRANPTPAKKKEERQNAAKGMKKMRDEEYKRLNNTVHGRKRLFWEATRDGCIFPCICCHRLMFKNSVEHIKDLNRYRAGLNGKKPGFFEEIIGPDVSKVPSCKGKYYLCSTCKRYISDKKMPPMSNQNDLEVFDNKEYPELNLTEMETSLIAKNLLFLKVYKLPTSRMLAIKDRVVCVPIDDDTINQTLQSLPRAPNEAGVVPVNWKRRKSDKGNHLQEWVNVDKIFKCLETLKNQGHSEYQSINVADFKEFEERCRNELFLDEHER